MDIEVSEVIDFLALHAPFDILPGRERTDLAKHMSIRYFRRGTTLIRLGTPNNHLFLIRSGAVDLIDADGILIDRTTTGDTFGSLSAMRRQPSTYAGVAKEDTLVLTLDGARFRQLFDEYQEIADYFTPRQRGRLGRATKALQEVNDPILHLTAADLSQRAPITAPPTVSIREAARVMTKARVSALLLADDEQRLQGIVTDRDLRSRVILTGADISLPISEVMTKTPTTVGPDTKAFELLMLMTEHGVHHLPIVRNGRAEGLVSAGDLMRLETSNPVYLVGDIGKQPDPEHVADVVGRAPQLAAQLLARGAAADDVTAVLTAVADAATSRLIHLAITDLGPAPHPWCWAALGSQARKELALGSDQDHALLVDNAADKDLRWYQEMAEFVVAGLKQCGFPRCKGEAMATKWCLTLDEWIRQFRGWITQPKSAAILHAQIFFDMRPIDGDHRLCQELRHQVIATAACSSRFLAQLAAMAVRREPPLGFFRGFVVERSGEHRDELDLKSGGLHAVIELVRVLALSAEITECGTLPRITALHAAGHLSDDQATELADAFRFLSLLRVRRHAEKTQHGEQPDNFIAPEALSAMERRHLRAAFEEIRRAQSALQHQFQTHLMN